MKRIVSVLIFTVAIITGRAQSVYQPYSYQFYQKLDPEVYSTNTREHTTIKPFFVDDSVLRAHFDTLMHLGADNKAHSWGYRKLFNEHLIETEGKGNTFYADFMPDLNVGRDFSNSKNLYSTTYGFQVGGTISKKFYYNVSGYINQAIFPSYLSAYINEVGVIPGQAIDHNPGNVDNWSYITAVASYTPVKFLNITFGRDKTFIGDGYRSMLLSDYAAPYPFLKLTADLGNVKYMVLWANFNDPMYAQLNTNTTNRNKWGVFHYLDWNVSNRVSFGFFDSIIWSSTDDQGLPRGFDINYINPVIFLRPVEASAGSPDNALIGFTGKYKISDGVTAYGQFSLDEFIASDFFSNNGSSKNKYGWQLGFRGGNFLGIKNLHYLLEYNTAKPYTYSERSSIQNYSEESEPLAHPWGANFREMVGLLNYSYKRWDFSGELDFGRYGLDANGENYGKNIFETYIDPARNPSIVNSNEGGVISFKNYTGQGLSTNLGYAEAKVAYILNPKFNLRLELSALYREEKSSIFDYNATIFTIGLKSSFRQVYNDLASFKAH